MDLKDLKTWPLDHQQKSIPGNLKPVALGRTGGKGWNLLAEDLPLPAAVLLDSALRHNSEWMRRFLEATGAYLAPHGKTTMSPQLFKRQLDDGAWGITVANVHQLQVARDHGVRRVVMANQLVGKQAIRYVLNELKRDPSFDFYCLVDSVEGVRMLADAAAAQKPGRPLQVMIEGGIEGGRTGVRDHKTAMKVARAIAAAAPHLVLRGIEGFEGLIRAKTPVETQKKVDAFLDFLADIAVEVGKAGLYGKGEVLLSAGGSAFYDRVVERFKKAKLERKVRIVIRSGCYLTHDEASYAKMFENVLARSKVARGLGEGLKPALEVWAYVQSRPEPTRALVTMGRRDAGADSGWPTPIKWFRPGKHKRPQAIAAGHACVNMNDQHGYLDIPAGSPLKVGDLVGFGINHPCTTFDKWQVIHVVDDEYNVIESLRTFF
jgi:D-serine dehydratase